MFNEDIFLKYPDIKPESLAKILPIAHKWAENFSVRPDKVETFVKNYFQMVYNKEKLVWFRSLIQGDQEIFLGCVGNLFILWDGGQIYYYELGTNSLSSPDVSHYIGTHLKGLYEAKTTYQKHETDENFLRLVDTVKHYFYNHYSEKGFNPWKLLRKNDTEMTKTLNALANSDLSKIKIGINQVDIIYSRQTRTEYGFKSNRKEYYGKIVDYILSKMRTFISKDVVSTLWFLQFHDARLAHWILAAKTPEARIYRMQALRTQSLLCPFALSRLHAFYPIKKKQIVGNTMSNYLIEIEAKKNEATEQDKTLLKVSVELPPIMDLASEHSYEKKTEKHFIAVSKNKATSKEKEIKTPYNAKLLKTIGTTHVTAIMTEAIDAGKAWQPYLQTLLNDIFYVEAKGLNSISAQRDFFKYGSRAIQTIIKKSPKLKPNSFLSLPFALRRNYQFNAYPWYWVAIGLSMGERQPVNRIEWNRFLALCDYAMPKNLDTLVSMKDGVKTPIYPESMEAQTFFMISKSKLESWLKGTPARWKDPYWEFLDNRDFSRVFTDTMQWLSPPRDIVDEGNFEYINHNDINLYPNLLNWEACHNPRSARSINLVYSIPLNRFINIDRALHEAQRRITDEVDETMVAKYGDTSVIEWSRALSEGIYEDEKAGLKIIELNNQHTLVAEGKNQQHCVGGYVHNCCTGCSRIYSVRRITDDMILSTFELRSKYNDKQGRMMVNLIQNQGHHNSTPPETSTKIVSKFVRLINSKKNPLDYCFRWPSVTLYNDIRKEREELFKRLMLEESLKYQLT